MAGRKMRDLTGERFHRLLVLSFLGRVTKSKSNFWRCQCSCGNIKDVDAGHLRSGLIRSCGCLFLEVAKRAREKMDHSEIIGAKCTKEKMDHSEIIKDLIKSIEFLETAVRKLSHNSLSIAEEKA